MSDREVIFGNKQVLDSYSIYLESTEPLQVTYDKGSEKELKLIFNFNVLDSNETPRGISVEPMGDAASFQVDIIKGKRGRMPTMQPIAESKESILYIYATFESNAKGAIHFTYTLLSEKIEAATNDNGLIDLEIKPKKKRRQNG